MHYNICNKQLPELFLKSCWDENVYTGKYTFDINSSNVLECL